jgi:hypothetical protein
LAIKTFRCKPQDLLEFKNFEYNIAEIRPVDEEIEVFGRGKFGDLLETFYLLSQGVAPHMHLAVAENFMEERYPVTYKSLKFKVPDTEIESLCALGSFECVVRMHQSIKASH